MLAVINKPLKNQNIEQFCSIKSVFILGVLSCFLTVFTFGVVYQSDNESVINLCYLMLNFKRLVW
jgi:hypothetical protein